MSTLSKNPYFVQVRECFPKLPSPQQAELAARTRRYTVEVEKRIKKVLRPRTVEDERGYVVSDARSENYGYGRTREEAWEDYYLSLVEDYEILSSADALSEHLQQCLSYLRQVFEGEI